MKWPSKMIEKNFCNIFGILGHISVGGNNVVAWNQKTKNLQGFPNSDTYRY